MPLLSHLHVLEILGLVPFGMNQPSLPTLFLILLLASVSVFMALSTLFHS